MSPAVADLATLLENASLKILVKILPLLKYTVVQTSQSFSTVQKSIVSYYRVLSDAHPPGLKESAPPIDN